MQLLLNLFRPLFSLTLQAFLPHQMHRRIPGPGLLSKLCGLCGVFHGAAFSVTPHAKVVCERTLDGACQVSKLARFRLALVDLAIHHHAAEEKGNAF